MLVPFVQFDFLSKAVPGVEMVGNSVDQTINHIDRIITPSHVVVLQNEVIDQDPVPENTRKNFNGLWACMAFVSLCFLIRFSLNLFGIIRSSRKHKTPIMYEGAHIALIEGLSTSYSFWNTIFLNKQSYLNQQIDHKILRHELFHIKQKHSADVLFIELLTAFFWYNPFLYLYKRAIKLNHEFLADERVVKESNQIFEYQSILVNEAGAGCHSFASSFNYLITKKRLFMITKITSPKSIFLRNTLLVGFSCFIVCSFGKANDDVDKVAAKLEEKVNRILLSEKNGGQEEVVDTISKKETIQFTPPPIKAKEKSVSGPSRKDRNWIAPTIAVKNEDEPDTVFQKTIIQYVHPQSDTDGKGITKSQLKEYETIIEKYKDDDGSYKNLAKNITDKEREQLRESYARMTKAQQAGQRIVVFSKWKPLEKEIVPNKDELGSWKNTEKFGVWINGEKVDNSALSNYKNTDFRYKLVNKLPPSAKEHDESPYRVDLMTTDGYNKYIERVENSKEPIFEKRLAEGRETLYQLDQD